MARWWGSKWLKYGVLALLGVGAAAALAPADSWIASTVKGPFDRNHRANWNAWKQENNKLWAERVVAGGYILHFRHAQREKWHDSAAFDAYEAANGIDASTSSFARATCLTEQGVEEAKLIGKVFEMVGVKVAQVFPAPVAGRGKRRSTRLATTPCRMRCWRGPAFFHHSVKTSTRRCAS
jgi:hypothetical protein